MSRVLSIKAEKQNILPLWTKVKLIKDTPFMDILQYDLYVRNYIPW